MKTTTMTAAFFALAALSPAQTAQEIAAANELETLATAMETAFIDTNWLTTLENLNDLGSVTTTRPYDYINDNGGALVISRSDGRFRDSGRLDLISRPIGLEWQGPYINVQPQYTEASPAEYDLGSPLDPWGTPYYFYTPLGLVDPQIEAIVLEGYEDDFNYFTIVSLGSDRVISGDDLTRTVGGLTILLPAVSSVRITPTGNRRAPCAMSINGYYFGSTQGTGEVQVNGSPVDGTITNWTNNLIVVDLNNLPTAGSTFTVQTDSGSAPSITGFIAEGAANVEGWQLY